MAHLLSLLNSSRQVVGCQLGADNMTISTVAESRGHGELVVTCLTLKACRNFLQCEICTLDKLAVAVQLQRHPFYPIPRFLRAHNWDGGLSVFLASSGPNRFSFVTGQESMPHALIVVLYVPYRFTISADLDYNFTCVLTHRYL